MACRGVAKAEAFFGHCQPIIVFGESRVELDRFAKFLGRGSPISDFLTGYASEHPGFGLGISALGGSLQQGEKGFLLSLFQ